MSSYGVATQNVDRIRQEKIAIQNECHRLYKTEFRKKIAPPNHTCFHGTLVKVYLVLVYNKIKIE
jgi:hypothetical protein